MKSIALIVALAVFAVLDASAPAWSQGAKPAAPAQAKKENEASTPKTPRAAPRKSSRRNEDARACLERGSNAAIIKCAEAYL